MRRYRRDGAFRLQRRILSRRTIFEKRRVIFIRYYFAAVDGRRRRRGRILVICFTDLQRGRRRFDDLYKKNECYAVLVS